MKKSPAVISTLVVVGLAAFALAQGAWKSSVNGKAVNLDVLESKGKVYVEANGLARALGIKVAVDAKKKSLSFSSASDAAPSVQGTTQLAGGIGELGKTYTLGLGTDDARNFTLTKLEYMAGHFVVGGDDLITREGKFLVLYATVQNPQKSGEITASKVRLSGVDSNNKTVNMADNWFDLKTREATYAGLKPGQKLEIFTYIPLENAPSLPKLIVVNGDKVIRYDLTGKIAPLIAPIADPGNPSAALEILKGVTGAFYPGYLCDLRLDGVTLSSQPVGGVGVPDGGQLLIVHFGIKASGPKAVALGGYNVTAQLRDADNQQIASQATLLASRDADFAVNLEPDQNGAGRFVFALEKGQKAASVRIQFGDSGGSRPVQFDLSGLMP